MSLSEFRFFSHTLGKQVSSFVILPDVGTPPFATFYLLHGLSDDYSIWLRRTRIEQYAARYPLAIVMPDGFRGAYTNADNGPQCATYMTADLIGAIERNFNVKPTRDARCIGGLSMGGYGSLRLSLGYPELFSSVTSHSGALMWGSLPPVRTKPTVASEFELIFGADPKGTEHDLQFLAARCKKQKTLPKLRIDCGTEDFLLNQNRTFIESLKSMKIPHQYAEYPGAHNWDYWDVHIQEALAFHARNLKLKVNK